jgi:hypothetical protein
MERIAGLDIPCPWFVVRGKEEHHPCLTGNKGLILNHLPELQGRQGNRKHERMNT